MAAVINSSNNSISSLQLLMEVTSSNNTRSSSSSTKGVEITPHHLSNSNSKGYHLRERGANSSKVSLSSPHSHSIKGSNLSPSSSSNSRLSKVSLNHSSLVEASKVSRQPDLRTTRLRSFPSTSNSKPSTVLEVRHLRTTTTSKVMVVASATPLSRHHC